MPALLAAAALVLAACATGPRPGDATGTAGPDPSSIGAIAGSVIDAETGEPIAMVELTARDDSGAPTSDLSDDGGRYRLADLTPGSYQLRAEWGELAVDVADVQVLAGVDTEIVVTFEPRVHGGPGEGGATGTRYGSIEGTVRDGPGGEPFPGALVTLVSSEYPSAIFAMADDQGRFEFPHLRESRYSLSCYYHLVDAGNIEVRRNNVVVERGKVTRVDLVLDFALVN